MSLVDLDLLLMLFLGLKLRFLVQFCVAQSCISGSTTPPAAHLHCSHDNKAILSFSSPPLQNSILLEVSFGGMALVTALLEFKWQVYQAGNYGLFSICTFQFCNWFFFTSTHW